MDMRLTGTVIISKRSKVSGDWVHKFTVRNHEDGQKYNFVLRNQFCVAEFGDVFSCDCICSEDNATMEGKPFIKVFNDDKSLKYNLLKMLPKNMPWKSKQSLSKELYPFLLNLSVKSEYDSIPQYLNAITYNWLNKGRTISSIRGFIRATPLDESKATTFICNWNTKYQMRQLRIFFYDDEVHKMNMPLDYIMERIMDNPYTLPQISIEKCEEIDSVTTRIPNDYDELCGTIIRDILRQCEKRSWMCVTEKWIKTKNPELKKLGYEDKLIDEFGCIFDTIKDNEIIYNEDDYKTEIFMAQYIEEQLNKPPMIMVSNILYTRDDLDDTQKTALENCFKKNFTIIAGDPGTGKTTLIDQITHNLDVYDIKYVMASFAGKAVSRIKDVTGREAYTLHKLLHKATMFKAATGETLFSHLIIDEASMVPTRLLKRVIEMYGRDFSITLVGDANQLPPIPSGSLLNECLKSRCVPYSLLRVNHRIYRQDGGVNGILYNSQMVSRWRTTDEFIFTQTDDFRIIEQSDRNNRYNITGILKDFSHFKSADIDIKRFVVLTPYKAVAKAVNIAAQRIFTSMNLSTTDAKEDEWYTGDKVIMRKNCYDLGVMNGEEGIIVEITDFNIKVDFYRIGERIIPTFPKNNKQLGERGVEREDEESKDVWTGWLLLAYALTIHKAQGSEWDFVMIYIPTFKRASSSFLNRNLLYTAFTRGKLQVIMRGSEALYSSIISTPPAYRCEYLSDRLKLVLDKADTNISEIDYIDPFNQDSSEDELWDAFDDGDF